ncbi:P-loop containing nucleoside triphosphate hydrolase protein [Diaporthe sp. PMI_573]|nr:P-loop containing nucleoside triphosphate hydrolase protein [Diaporthaceae sp. PMI_573]
MNKSVTEPGPPGPGITSQASFSAANLSSSPDVIANISVPQLATQLSSMLGASLGFGIPMNLLLEVMFKHLGLETSVAVRYTSWAGTVCTLYLAWVWAWPRVFSFLLRHFAASIEIEGRDQLFNVLMAEWRKQTIKHKKDSHLRRCLATSENGTRDRFWDDDEESEDENDDQPKNKGYVMVNGRPNLATQSSKVSFTPRAGRYWLDGIYSKRKNGKGDGPTPGTPFRIMMFRELQPKHGIYSWTDDAEARAYKMFLSSLWIHGPALQAFTKKLLQDYNAKLARGNITVYRHSLEKGEHRWVRNRKDKIRHRPEKSVCISPKVAESFLGDMQRYIMQRELLKARGVITRRGYLLHGEPGTGKTSLVQVAATVFGLKMYIISMSRFWGTAADLTELINAMEKPGILLLEDLDTANPRLGKSKDATLAALLAESKSAGSSGGNGLLETLLQTLDGVGAAQDRIAIITTNRVEALDKALIRPGRIDVKIECGLATDEMAEQMFLRFFGPLDHSDSDEGESGDDEERGVEGEGGKKKKKRKEEKKKLEELPSQLSPEEAERLAKLFGQRLGGEKLSGADLENYCVTIFGDPKKGVDGAVEWKEKTLAEKKELKTKRQAAAVAKAGRKG